MFLILDNDIIFRKSMPIKQNKYSVFILKKTYPQTVLQHHRTGLLQNRAEMLCFYFYIILYDFQCISSISAKESNSNYYHIENVVSLITMKHCLVYLFLEVEGEVYL